MFVNRWISSHRWDFTFGFVTYEMIQYLTLTKTKLRGFSSQAILPTERPPLVGEVTANFRE
jgi:hypothetical protein